jgi:hypothetical protein
MAPYYRDPNLDDDKNDVNQTVKFGGGAPSGDSAGFEQPQKGQGATHSGSGFQNLDKYLQANNAKDFGGQFTGKVQNELTNAGTQMQGAGEQFKSQVAGANPNLASQSQISQAIANPETADKEQFAQWRDQQYTGPNSLADSEDAWNKYWSGTQKAGNVAKGLNSEAGRFGLLDQYFGRPSYSSGEKGLDNYLLQNSGSGRDLRGIQKGVSDLQTQGTKGAESLGNLATTKAGLVNQNRQDVRGAIGINDAGQTIRGQGAGALGSLEDQIQSGYENQLKSGTALKGSIPESLKTGQFSQEELNSLGLKPGQQTWNLNLDDYYTPQPDVTLSQSASPEERARHEALSQLAGVPNSFLGEAPARGASFDQARFGQDQAAAEKAYNDKIGAFDQYNNNMNDPSLYAKSNAAMGFDKLDWDSILNQNKGPTPEYLMSTNPAAYEELQRQNQLKAKADLLEKSGGNKRIAVK